MLPEILPDAMGCIAPGLGHGWNLEAPDLFDEVVRAWIGNKPLPRELKTVGP